MDQLSIYLPGLLLAYTACFLGLMSPGPNVLAVIGTAMGEGRKPGLALGFGVAAGSFCWATLTVAGLTTLITAYAWLLGAIKIAGGLYLLWLGFKALRSAATSKEIQTRRLGLTGGASAYFMRGLIVQMTNPKAALVWIAIVSLAIQPDAPLWVYVAFVLGTGTLSTVGHAVYAVAFSTRPMVTFYGRARRWIEACLGAFFCFAGIKLLTSRT